MAQPQGNLSGGQDVTNKVEVKHMSFAEIRAKKDMKVGINSGIVNLSTRQGPR